MARANPNTDITFSQRYECKYLVSPMLASSIRQFIRPFMRPDHFAEIFVQRGTMRILRPDIYKYRTSFAAIVRRSPKPSRSPKLTERSW